MRVKSTKMLCFNKFYYLTHPRIFMMTCGRICKHESTFAGGFVTLTPQRMERLRASSNLMFNAFKISGEVQRSQRQVLDLRRRAVEIAEASHVVEFQRQILMSAMMQACIAKGKARSDLLRVMVGDFTFLRGT